MTKTTFELLTPEEPPVGSFVIDANGNFWHLKSANLWYSTDYEEYGTWDYLLKFHSPLTLEDKSHDISTPFTENETKAFDGLDAIEALRGENIILSNDNKTLQNGLDALNKKVGTLVKALDKIQHQLDKVWNV
jgi:hypothetical protein